MNDQYLTVTALTKYIKHKLSIDKHLQSVWLKGEISNFIHHRSGNMYFTMKDEQAVIRCMMASFKNRQLRFTPENGMEILVKGNVSVYEKSGQYQLYIDEMKPDGIGALYLAYEQLKETLGNLGYFSPENKKAIPSYPKRIAVITSPTAAAVRDIMRTLTRRYPIVEIIVIPAIVQGEDAPSSIVRALAKAEQLQEIDTIILGRGGGSIEDLWAFNDRIVADAIYQSTIPIITGIGHETDFTISDFVADLRGSTPTGAAELAVPSLVELKEQLNNIKANLDNQFTIYLMNKQKPVHALKSSQSLQSPKQLIYEKSQQVDRLQTEMTNNIKSIHSNKKNAVRYLHTRIQSERPARKLKLAQERLDRLAMQFTKNSHTVMFHKGRQLNQLIEKLTILNPLQTMKRGFVISKTSENTLVKSIEQLNVNDMISLHYIDGVANCTVNQVRSEPSGKKDRSN